MGKNLLVTYSSKLKERSEIKDKSDPNYLEASSIPNQFKGIKKLFNANDIDFNWTTVESTFPAAKSDNTRAYTSQEIKKGVLHADVKSAAGIFIYATSAIRRGGIQFRWADFHPVYRDPGGVLQLGIYDDEYDVSNPLPRI